MQILMCWMMIRFTMHIPFPNNLIKDDVQKQVEQQTAPEKNIIWIIMLGSMVTVFSNYHHIIFILMLWKLCVQRLTGIMTRLLLELQGQLINFQMSGQHSRKRMATALAKLYGTHVQYKINKPVFLNKWLCVSKLRLS